jgi:hypothetical protein
MLTRFTIRHVKILIVDNAILKILIGHEICVTHFTGMIKDLPGYWWEAWHICGSCYFIIISPLPIFEFVDMSQLKRKKILLKVSLFIIL